MRDAFAKEVGALAAADPRIVVLAGDIGNRMFDAFKAKFPGRFYNCGVAEANMIGVGAGLALSGMRPFVYTIASFATARCLEQIRIDLCYHHLPVTVVGVGAGLCYASLGATHHALEDIAALRLLPGMTVVCPADPMEVQAAVRATLAIDGPIYLRLGKKGEPALHASPPDFRIGQSITLRPGTDVALLGVGNAVQLACDVAKRLSQAGISARVESFHTIKPLDECCLSNVFSTCKLVATIEEHSRSGGAGGAVAEWLAITPHPSARFVAFGTSDIYLHEAASRTHARERFGLTADGIFDTIIAALKPHVVRSSPEETP